MPTALKSNGGARREIRSAFRRFCLRSFFGPIAAVTLMVAALACSGCKKQSSREAAEEVAEKSDQSLHSIKRDKKKSWEGDAVWYDVPDNSLAERRAGKGELTAAHNRLRLGSLVRVTHLANGKSVIVRITDRGITNRANIDLCKEAAEELGMIREGRARVRIELLPDDSGVDAGLHPSKTAAQP